MEVQENKVDIIVPVYNVEKYIEASVESICKQNFDSFRVILVNDGTKDNSIAVALKILEQHHTPYKIIEQENRGLPAARNTGLRNATAKYVIFVDSDDIISENFIERLYNACEENGVFAAFSEYEVTHLNNRNGNDHLFNGIKVLTRDELLFSNMTRNIKIHLCAILINREFLIKNNLWFNETLRFGEEVDYTWRMYPLLNQIVHVKAKMYKYLVRENSLMTNQNTDRVITMLDAVHTDLEEWYSRSPGDRVKYKWAEQKIYFEKVHAFAQQAKYSTFLDLLKRTDYKNRVKVLRDFPDIKIRVLSLALRICPYSFWMLFQLHKL